MRVEKNGRIETFHPGDWCKMGRQQARDYLATGQIEILKSAVLQTVQDLSNCAIVLRNALEEPRLGILTAKFPGVPIQLYSNGFPDYGRFLLWNTDAELDHNLIMVGFKLLETWQIAVPILSYQVLAEHVGTEAERKQTQDVIHDLRVPVYDTRIMFVRQCQETRKLFELWNNGSQLEFLQALYQSRPIVNALPPSWVLK